MTTFVRLRLSTALAMFAGSRIRVCKAIVCCVRQKLHKLSPSLTSGLLRRSASMPKIAELEHGLDQKGTVARVVCAALCQAYVL